MYDHGNNKDYQDKIHILDLGREGVSIYDNLDVLIHNVAEYGNEDRSLGREFFREVVTDVVRLLNIPPTEALQQCKWVPRTDTFRDMVTLFRIREIDVVRHACYESALILYQKLRKQLGIDLHTQYTTEYVGLDHVAIRINRSFPFV